YLRGDKPWTELNWEDGCEKNGISDAKGAKMENLKALNSIPLRPLRATQIKSVRNSDSQCMSASGPCYRESLVRWPP
ncbi:hypothetical protein HAX54_011839, partial [Datura stramonium]|nr:hypothetical protein [Datura stramonium]